MKIILYPVFINLFKSHFRDIIRIMKITFVLSFVFIVSMYAAEADSQTAKVSFTKTNTTIKDIINEIEDQTEYLFVYNKDEIPLNEETSISVREEAVALVLKKVFGNTDVAYAMEGNNIMLMKNADLQQNVKKIRGKVTEQNGEPVIGANVIVKGASAGTITDVNGDYSITLPEGSGILVFSYIGYITQEQVAGDQTQIDVVLQEDILKLNEIVVIGYGSIKKRDLTGAVSQLNSDVLKNQAVMNDPMQALQGKIPGMDITSGNQPGVSSTIVIRGFNSLNASNNPLIILDGAPFGGRLDEINPVEIENIDVLKDASSTAIYGSRGANGVIIVTTKRAKKGSKVSIGYDSYVGISKSFKNYNMMSGPRYADYKRQANNGKTDAEIFDQIQLDVLQSGAYVDWQDEMFGGTGYKTDQNVTINQASEKIRNMIVLGYNRDQSIIRNMNYQRFTGRINGDMELSNTISMGYSALLTSSTRHDGESSVWTFGTVLDPLTKIYDEEGNKLFYNSGWYQTLLHSNPMYDLEDANVDGTTQRTRIIANLFFDWQIIDGLNLRTSFTPDFTAMEYGSYRSPVSQDRQLGQNWASYEKASEKQITLTGLLNYKKQFGKHALDASAVFDLQDYSFDNINLTGQDLPYYGKWYNVNEAPSIYTRGSGIREWAMLSYMGRLNYIYNDKYLLTLTGRYDGSSRLAQGHKWDFFPSFAVAWRLNEEEFLKSIEVLNNLKLRFSWGNTGNTAIDPYATQGTLGKNAYYFGYAEQAAMGYLPTELPNEALGWERTEEYNIGLDFGFFRNRLGGTIDLYRRNTHDLLMKRNLPITSGYPNTWQNIGQTRNSGIEVALNTVPVVTKNFKWQLNLSFGYNKNEIIELFNGKEDSPGDKWFIGKPFYVEWLYQFDGVWQLGEENEAAVYGRTPGEPKIKDINQNNTYDQADLKIYNKIPKWTGGISSTMNYKNFDFSFYLYTRQNYGQVLPMLTYEAGSTRVNHIDVDFWTPDNPSNTFPKPKITNPQDLLVTSDYSFRDLSFVRLKNVNLGYTFPKHISEKAYMQNLRIYFAIDNPYVWTVNQFEGLDPENCFAYDSHRPLTSFLLGFNVKF
ncbi:MAG: TonB-dependent receptor [Dysgonamonadaceae bacterium]|jgi:TonB-linked SusC/RagA family outer membrane protein|nr:TonB-dependent receptor [Dysgonamonadaceae bacterium]